MAVTPTTSFALDPDASCEQCGRTGAYRFETATLCIDCYQQRGACCAETAGNDLTLQGGDSAPPRQPSAS